MSRLFRIRVLTGSLVACLLVLGEEVSQFWVASRNVEVLDAVVEECELATSEGLIVDPLVLAPIEFEKVIVAGVGPQVIAHFVERRAFEVVAVDAQHEVVGGRDKIDRVAIGAA